MQGYKCGCGKVWRKDHVPHNIHKCSWTMCTGDVICSDYSRDVHGDLNTIKSYLNLAVKETCRCLPSMTLLKHGRASIRCINDSCFHLNEGAACGWIKANCETFCTTCIHYCGIQHGC